MVQSATQLKNTFAALLIIQLVVQVCMKGSYVLMFNIILYLQIIKTLTLYQVDFPATHQIVLDQIRSIVDFDALKGDALLELFGIDTTVREILGFEKEQIGQSNLARSGFEDSSIILNFVKQYAIIFAFLGLFIVVTILLSLNPKAWNWLKKKLTKLYSGFIWTGALRSYVYSYINQCIFLVVYLEGPNFRVNVESVGTIIMNSNFILVVPLFLVYFFYKSTKYLDNDKVDKRFSLLRVRKSMQDSYGKYQLAMFILRRMLIVLNVVCLQNFPGC